MGLANIGKKGQSLSVNVIIVAALALVVLVVLVVIFMQQTNRFSWGVSEGTKTELAAMRISYGNCHPGSALEKSFQSDYEAAELAENKDEVSSRFRQEINRCNGFTDQDICGEGCLWGK